MQYNILATAETISETIKALGKNGVEAEVVENQADALARIKALIPVGVSVMNGSSVTLEQIGFVEYLKSGRHGWNNLHAAIVAEKDPAKQSQLRKQALLADYYLGSVNALSENGEFVIGSNTGSQLPHIVFSSKNLIFVAGAQKLVSSVDAGLKRIEEYVLPLENEKLQKKYGVDSMLSKIVIFKRENQHMGRAVRMIIVNKALGF